MHTVHIAVAVCQHIYYTKKTSTNTFVSLVWFGGVIVIMILIMSAIVIVIMNVNVNVNVNVIMNANRVVYFHIKLSFIGWLVSRSCDVCLTRSFVEEDCFISFGLVSFSPHYLRTNAVVVCTVVYPLLITSSCHFLFFLLVGLSSLPY